MREKKKQPDLEELAKKLRRWSVVMTSKSGASHVGSCLSAVEVIAALYGRILRFDPDKPDWEDRDRMIISKGHAAAVYYAVLGEMGFFPLKWLESFYENGAVLHGHVTHTNVPGVEISTGSLGHGLSVATGMALAANRDGRKWRVYCLLSDGECNEGSTWEPIMFAAQHRLHNLTAIIDYNKVQSLGNVKDVIDLEPLADKFESFGWLVSEIDGHDLDGIVEALRNAQSQDERPSCIIAHTVKGKGVSFMEGRLLWHYRTPRDEEYRRALAEIG